MSIRITQKRPIQLKIVAASGNTLDVTFYAQAQSNWCWNACYQMVFNFFNFTISQCSIAQQVSWNTYGNCCGKPFCCNNACSVAQVSLGWNKWSYNYTYINNYISYTGIKTTIDNNHIVEAGLGWNGGGFQLVLVIGYVVGNTNYVHINDPANSQTAVTTYGYLRSAYGNGTWNNTWDNISN